jgi:Fe-S oxidoreductase
MAFECSYHLEKFDTQGLPERFLDAFAAILAHSNYGPLLDAAARMKARCGQCSVSCPVYQTTGERRDIPCERSELLLRIYRRYFTLGGATRARLGDPWHLTEADLNRLAEDYYRCTACRRCQLECPLGIDHGLITHVGRWILAEVGIVPKALRVAVREQLEGETHNTSAIPFPALADTCEFLAEDAADEHGIRIEFPIDREGAEYVFFPAVSDFLLEPDTLTGNAAVMAATGGSWTLSSRYYDGINYGLFYSDRMFDRIIQHEVAEWRRLGARAIMIGECGHASRAAKIGLPNFAGGRDAPPIVNCLEYAYQKFRSGELELQSGAITERVTYHDPCNIARNGWIVEQPRALLRHICADYVDMQPHGTKNYCCGGGGGTVSLDEIRAFRTGVGGAAKAAQIRATGASICVCPCANCKKQVAEVCADHGLEVQVVGLHDLLLKALVVPDAMKVAPPTDPPATQAAEEVTP